MRCTSGINRCQFFDNDNCNRLYWQVERNVWFKFKYVHSEFSDLRSTVSDYPCGIFTHLAIVLSVLRSTVSDYPLGIFKHLTIALSVLPRFTDSFWLPLCHLQTLVLISVLYIIRSNPPIFCGLFSPSQPISTEGYFINSLTRFNGNSVVIDIRLLKISHGWQ
jgi:hypothetical protein